MFLTDALAKLSMHEVKSMDVVAVAYTMYFVFSHQAKANYSYFIIYTRYYIMDTRQLNTMASVNNLNQL